MSNQKNNVAGKLSFQTMYKRHVVKGESSKLPSLTVPDETMSIPEIMQRFASGRPLGGVKTPIFDADDPQFEGRDPRTLDYTEIHDAAEEADKRIKDNETGKKRYKARKEAERLLDEERKNLPPAPQA